MPTAATRRRTTFAGALLMGVLGLLGLLVWQPTTLERLSFAPPITARRQTLFDEQLRPLVAELHAENQAAAARALERIDELFARYRRGVRPFAEDLTSISTRLGIARRLPGNWWYEDQRVEGYVREKFEVHLFSAERLTSDLEAVMLALRTDLEANRNRMLTQVRTALSSTDIPLAEVPDTALFATHVQQQLVAFYSERGIDSVRSGLTALVASEAASLAAEQLVAIFLASFVAEAATTSAAAGGGATVGGVATGGGAGLLGGPVGAAIGIGVGLVIGIAVDWYMSERFEAELIADLTTYLNSLQRSLIDGRTVDGVDQPGLRRVLENFAKELNAAEERALRRVVVGA